MKTHSTLLLALVAVAGSACGEKPAPKSDSPVAPKAVAEVTPAILAKLQKADAVDGKADKVVSKCAGCALGMDGKSEHAVTVGGYTLHFCDHCAGMVADPLKAIEALKN